MRKKVSIFLVLFTLFFSIKVFAAETININGSINGEIKKGNEIEILFNIDNIKSLYAGAMYYKYDPSVLKIKEIIPGDLISKSGINKFEATKSIDESKGLVSYAFTCMGDINGFSGKGTFVKLKAEVLEDKDFKITSSFNNKTPNDEYTVRLQICDSNIVELPYNFTGINYKVKSGQEVVNDSNTSGNNSSSNNGGTNAATNNGNTTNNSSEGENNPNNSNNVNEKDNETKPEVKSSKGNDSNEVKNNNLGNGTKENKIVDSKDSSYAKTQKASKIILYVLGGLGIASMGIWGIFKLKNK